MARTVLESFEAEFRRYRGLAENSAGQLSWEQVRAALDPEVNSIAVIMKHVGGNLRSRWTDPFTTDGEKPWRDRDSEFVDDFVDRPSLERAWASGWEILEGLLASCSDADVSRVLTIRGEPHTLALALARSLAHTAYHCGQIVHIARVHASRSGSPWKDLTVPRGGSELFNRARGFNSGQKCSAPAASDRHFKP